jgi:hypothetical protein
MATTIADDRVDLFARRRREFPFELLTEVVIVHPAPAADGVWREPRVIAEDPIDPGQVEAAIEIDVPHGGAIAEER